MKPQVNDKLLLTKNFNNETIDTREMFANELFQ